MADTYVDYNGYQYDARILGAPLEIVRLRERLNEAKNINAGTLALGLAVESLERILADRAKGSHVAARRAESDEIVCVCGLVVAPGTDVTRASGHLNQDTWLPADGTSSSISSSSTTSSSSGSASGGSGSTSSSSSSSDWATSGAASAS